MKLKFTPLTLEDFAISKAVVQRSFINPLVERTIEKIREGQSALLAERFLSVTAEFIGTECAKSHLSDAMLMLARRCLLTPPPVVSTENSLETLALCEEVCNSADFPTIGGAVNIALNFQEILK